MNKDFNIIKSAFLKLTSKTYPYGYEDDLVNEMKSIGLFSNDLKKDIHDNYYLEIGDSSTIFASHLDTACKDQIDVKHVINDNIIKTNGKSILGADDKAGVTVLLWLIRNNIPGLYYFFIGEEVGCIGSGLLSKKYEFGDKYKRIISFDRRGNTSIITHQSSIRTCSDEFAIQLAKELNKTGNMSFKKDDTGVYTDSAEFVRLIPECTNISVGYNKEHTNNESQDINHLYRLCMSCLNVDWESLPTKRDKSKIEDKYASFYTPYNSRKGTRYNTNRYGRSYSSSNYSNDEYSDSYEFKPSNLNSRDWSNNSFEKNNKRGKRGSKKNRVFYDNGSELVEITKISTNKYESLKDKFLNTSLSVYEIEIIKEQYLDMNDPSDRDYYEVLQNNLSY